MRIILTFLTIILTATLTFGQKLSVGSEVGIISSINTDYETTDYENRRNTYYGGINFNYQYNNRLSVTTGLHYLRQGYRHSTCYIFEEGVKNELTGKYDYLSIPITINIHFLQSRKLITSFGILGAYNIKAIQDYPVPIGGCVISYIPNMADRTRDYSFSGIISIGYKIIEIDHCELITSLKYYQGLTNSFKNPYHNIELSIDRKYSSALLTMQFNYKL